MASSTTSVGISEKKSLSFSEILGMILILIGLIFLILSFIKLFNSEQIAVGFFITMLGYAMLNPALLESPSGLSTMRVAVFMIVNVVCMLMLKIGWNPEIKSFANLQIDTNWVALIGLVLGAKATQTFAENKASAPAPQGQAQQGKQGQ
jgi:hypothetical protein